MDDFRSHEHDAQRDNGFDGQPRHMRASEPRARESEAVRDGKRRDGCNEPARAFHQHQEREDEQQMVNSVKNLFNARF